MSEKITIINETSLPLQKVLKFAVESLSTSKKSYIANLDYGYKMDVEKSNIECKMKLYKES